MRSAYAEGRSFVAIASKNHYLPQFYLARWTTKEPRGSEYKLWAHWISPVGEPISRRKTTGAVGYGIDTLTITDPVTSHPSDVYELEFRDEVDTPAADVVRDLITRKKLNPTQKEIFLRLVLSMHSRRPGAAATDDEHHRRLVAIENALFQARGIERTGTSRRDVRAEARGVAVDARRAVAGETDWLNHLPNKSWRVLGSESEVYTADEPTTGANTGRADRLPSWLAIALSPSDLLLIGTPPYHLRARRRLLSWYNQTLVDRVRQNAGARLFTLSNADVL
jgi:hypothetical protein